MEGDYRRDHRINYMFGCIFSASGYAFDVNKFLANSSLSPDDVYHCGETTEFGNRIHNKSGFLITISKVFGELQPQIKDATLYLELNRTELHRLSQCRDVNDIRLGFSYCPGIGSNTCEYFPPELLSLVGSLRIGIELSVYPGENVEGVSE